MNRLHFLSICGTDGYSPAEMFLNRNLRVGRPIHPSHYEFKPVLNSGLPLKMQKQKREYSKLSVGQICLLQSALTKLWTVQCRVISIRDNHRSYYVQNLNNKLYLRNRIYLQPLDKSLHNAQWGKIPIALCPS